MQVSFLHARFLNFPQEGETQQPVLPLDISFGGTTVEEQLCLAWSLLELWFFSIGFAVDVSCLQLFLLLCWDTLPLFSSLAERINHGILISSGDCKWQCVIKLIYFPTCIVTVTVIGTETILQLTAVFWCFMISKSVSRSLTVEMSSNIPFCKVGNTHWGVRPRFNLFSNIKCHPAKFSACCSCRCCCILFVWKPVFPEALSVYSGKNEYSLAEVRYDVYVHSWCTLKILSYRYNCIGLCKVFTGHNFEFHLF